MGPWRRAGLGAGGELFQGEEIVATGVTDSEGRISFEADLDPGRYRLVFHPASSAFFSRVEVEIAIDQAGKNFHVPLLVSPYSCTTYRGS